MKTIAHHIRSDLTADVDLDVQKQAKKLCHMVAHMQLSYHALRKGIHIV